jgi:outer membrane protein
MIRPNRSLGWKWVSAIVWVSCLGLVWTARWGWAEDGKDVPLVKRIAWVDLDRIFKEYKGTQQFEQKLDELSKSKQKERERRVSEIRNLRDELILLDSENRAAQQKRLDEKFRELMEFDQKVREELRNEREEALRAILKEIESSVKEFAKARGFDLILTDRAILYGAEGLDVTDEILEIINQKR